MSRNEEIMQKIENNENVWERTRDESPEALCLPELLSLLYWRMWGLSASGFSVVIDIQTHVARSWLYRGGISVFTIWVLSRFYLSSVAILSEFYRGFFWRNFKNSKWAIFAGDKVDLHVCRIFRKKTKSGFESKKQKTFQKFKISNFHRRQSPVSTKFTVVPSSTTVTKTSLFHAENPSFSL